jgi:hypothetical protein
VDQLISYLIMAKDNEATLFAAKSMLEGETGITTITEGGEVGWCDALLHGYGIPVLLGGEFSPVNGGGEERTTTRLCVAPSLLYTSNLPSEYIK